VLATAAAEPERLVVGVDASAAAMAEASRRAARRPDRGGLPNARFVVAAAEALPAGLEGLADRVTVHFPWGSLLRGLLTADPVILEGLARTMHPGATLSLLVSSTDRDRGAGVGPVGTADLAALAPGYAAHGLVLTMIRPATAADVAASRSTWGRRLGAGDRRPAWLVEARRDPASAGLGQAGQAGPGLVEPAGGRVQLRPGVGGGETVADGA
jgi:16S rRNA (adenine(1408)-N(1))-methyltransferase